MRTLLKVLIMGIMYIMLFSCASAPDPAQKAPSDELASAGALSEQTRQYDLAIYAADELAAVDEIFRKGKDLFTSDAGKSREYLTQAITEYCNLLDTWLPLIALEKQKVAVTNRERATGIKADVALPEAFGAADQFFRGGVDALDRSDHRAAIDFFDRAAIEFMRIYEDAMAKRGRVAAALEALDTNLKIVERKAEEMRMVLAEPLHSADLGSAPTVSEEEGK